MNRGFALCCLLEASYKWSVKVVAIHSEPTFIDFDAFSFSELFATRTV